MRITRNLEFQTGSKEEKLPYKTTDFPYVASQAELDDYREPFVPWHWHNAIELFYMESGQLKYHTPNETMVFSVGWAGMVNSNVLHMTEIQTHKEKNIQLLHIFEPKLLAGDHGSRIEQKYIMPITTSSQIEILPLNPKVPEQACNSPMATDEMIEELEQYNRDTVKIFQRGIEEGILKQTSPVLLISFCYYPIQQIFKEWRKEKSMLPKVDFEMVFQMCWDGIRR